MNALDHVTALLRALESGAVGDALARYYHPDVVQVEHPNRLNPMGQRRDLAALIASSIQGAALMASQQYRVVSALVDGDRVALELEWRGTLAVPVAHLAAGAELRAHIGMFVELRDGLIVSQRNHDCFDAF